MRVLEASAVDLIVLHGEDGKNAESGYLGIDDGRVVASGAFFLIDGRLWAAVTIYERRPGAAIVRAVKRILDECPMPVYAQHNETHATAERLMKILGFEPTRETRHGLTVWRK